MRERGRETCCARNSVDRLVVAAIVEGAAIVLLGEVKSHLLHFLLD